MYGITGCHDSQADQYEAKVLENLDDYIRENYFQILDRVVELVPQNRRLHVLDIGIGTGLLTQRMPTSLDLYGIDISPKMMKKVREKAIPVQLKCGSFLDIPYDDGYFDGIVSTFAFHHLSPAEKDLSWIEMDRVLKSDAFIIIGDFMFENNEQAMQLVEKFRHEGRTDMLEEFEEEHFTYIDVASTSLKRLGFRVQYERGSTLSWVLKATRTTVA